jgi:hypothetical protein
MQHLFMQSRCNTLATGMHAASLSCQTCVSLGQLCHYSVIFSCRYNTVNPNLRYDPSAYQRLLDNAGAVTSVPHSQNLPFDSY